MRPPCTCGDRRDPYETNPNCPHHGYDEDTGESGQTWDEGYQEYLADCADEEPPGPEREPWRGWDPDYPH